MNKLKIKDMTIEELRKYRRDRIKEWRIKNPEKNKIARIKYKKSNKGRAANNKYNRKRYAEEADNILEAQRKRYAENPTKNKQSKEYIKIYMRTYLNDPEKRKKFLQRQRDYRKFRLNQIDKSECSSCGSIKNLEIHHIDYEYNTNIIILCRRCHRRLHRIQINEETGGKNGKTRTK